MVLLQIGQDLRRRVVQFDVGFGFQTLQLWIVQSQSPEQWKESVCISKIHIAKQQNKRGIQLEPFKLHMFIHILIGTTRDRRSATTNT